MYLIVCISEKRDKSQHQTSMRNVKRKRKTLGGFDGGGPPMGPKFQPRRAVQDHKQLFAKQNEDN